MRDNQPTPAVHLTNEETRTYVNYFIYKHMPPMTPWVYLGVPVPCSSWQPRCTPHGQWTKHVEATPDCETSSQSHNGSSRPFGPGSEVAVHNWQCCLAAVPVGLGGYFPRLFCFCLPFRGWRDGPLVLSAMPLSPFV